MRGAGFFKLLEFLSRASTPHLSLRHKSAMNPEEPHQPHSSPQPQPQHISARVPERVGPGIFSTGVLVMTGNTEFILDFIQNLGQPAQVAARIVMPHATMPQFIHALKTNLDMYKNRFGTPPELPPPNPNQKKPTLQEIYDDLKISDDTLAGCYANGVMIGHAASEFKFDFLANMMPTPAVSSRVYLSAPQVPRLLQSLTKTYEEFQRRVAEQQRKQQQEQNDEKPDEEGLPPTE